MSISMWIFVLLRSNVQALPDRSCLSDRVNLLVLEGQEGLKVGSQMADVHESYHVFQCIRVDLIEPKL